MKVQGISPRFGSGLSDLWASDVGRIETSTGFGFHYVNEDHPTIDAVVRLVKEHQPIDVLDIAAGRGIATFAINRHKPDTRILATDIDEAGLKAIAQKAQTEGLPIETQTLDIATRHFPDKLKNKFHLVVAKDVYPFLNPGQIKRFLRNAADALQPGGWFVVTAPSDRSDLYQRSVQRNQHQGWYQKLSESAQRFVPTRRSHFAFADIERLAKQLKQAGFQMTEAFHYGKAKGWITAIAQKTLSVGQLPRENYEGRVG